MARPDAFWDRLAQRYAAQPVANETAYQTKLAETRRLFRPDMDILEFGCGTGSTAITHAPLVRHILATDFSARMVEIARAKAEKAGITNVTFEQADITKMPVERDRYDMVMGHSILHLLANPQAAIDASFARLKAGGYFVTSTACLGGGAGLILALIAPLGRLFGLLPTLKAFTADQLKDMHRKSGFDIVHSWKPEKGGAAFIIAQKPV